MKNLSIIAVFMMMAVASFAQSSWNVDKAHSILGFNIFHNSIAEFSGNFQAFESSITSNGDNFDGASMNVTIETASVNTQLERRDNHLRSADFFDAEKYPTISFTSGKWKKTGNNSYKAEGDMTFKGVTKKVNIDITVTGTTTHPQSKKEMAGFKFKTTFKRSDFGVAPEFGSVSDEVSLNASAQFAKS